MSDSMVPTSETGRINYLLIRRLAAVFVVLTTLLGGVDFYWEWERIDHYVMGLAKSASSDLPERVFERLVTGTAEERKDAAQEVVSHLGPHFVTVAFRAEEEKTLVNIVHPSSPELTPMVKVLARLPRGEEAEYDRVWIGKNMYLAFVMPVHEAGTHLEGYLEGIYRPDPATSSAIMQDVYRTLAMVVAAIFVTTAVLYPLVINLEGKLINLNRSLEDRVVERTEALNRANQSLAKAKGHMEQELSLAREVFARILAPSNLDLPGLRYHFTAKDEVSGDILLGGETPDGRRIVLLGDFTGHGLAAALGALPVTELFEEGVRSDADLEALLGTLNSVLRRRLPTGIFLAAAAAEFEPSLRRLRLWNGGLPTVLHFDAEGNLIRRLPSTDLPLGIVDSYTATVATLEGDADGQVYLYSDGVVEEAAPDGSHFGEARLLEFLSRGLPDPIGRLQAHLADFRGHRPPHDDISIAELRLLGET